MGVRWDDVRRDAPVSRRSGRPRGVSAPLVRPHREGVRSLLPGSVYRQYLDALAWLYNTRGK